MKLPIRFFGVGLLTASLIFAISMYFFNDSSPSLEEESIENIAAHLEEEGYYVVTQEEYISFAVKENEAQNKENKEVAEKVKISDTQEDMKISDTKKDENVKDEASKSSEKENKDQHNKKKKDEEKDQKPKKKKKKDEEKDQKPKKKKKKKKVYKYTLTVEENMLGPTISKLLVKNKIIDDADAFTNYLEEKDYSRSIQLGDYKLNSDMTFYEIAEKITGN